MLPTKNALSVMQASPVVLQAGDISYIWTGEGWLYLAVILDLYSRRVIALSWFARANRCRAMDNSMVETFFKSIKAELIWRNRWATKRQAEGAIFQYTNGFYNLGRQHSSLGGKSPLAFERKAA